MAKVNPGATQTNSKGETCYPKTQNRNISLNVAALNRHGATQSPFSDFSIEPGTFVVEAMSRDVFAEIGCWLKYKRPLSLVIACLEMHVVYF